MIDNNLIIKVKNIVNSRENLNKDKAIAEQICELIDEGKYQRVDIVLCLITEIREQSQ